MSKTPPAKDDTQVFLYMAFVFLISHQDGKSIIVQASGYNVDRFFAV